MLLQVVHALPIALSPGNPFSQSHVAVSLAPPVVGDTTSSATPHVTIKYPAR
ncbi:hypothetical protein BDR06DRAFT_965107 [Suillus hirtellus]|nr:hypothetical protein BDR06DRAFT_965107 [Suillus hirtellus]